MNSMWVAIPTYVASLRWPYTNYKPHIQSNEGGVAIQGIFETGCTTVSFIHWIRCLQHIPTFEAVMK
jgi:hypothetical protein